MAELAGFLAFAWVPMPGFPARWSRLPQWAARAMPVNLSGTSLAVLWNIMHFHGIYLIMLDKREYVPIFASWCLMKLWIACFFHGSVRIIRLCPVLAAMSTLIELRVTFSVTRDASYLAGIVGLFCLWVFLAFVALSVSVTINYVKPVCQTQIFIDVSGRRRTRR